MDTQLFNLIALLCIDAIIISLTFCLKIVLKLSWHATMFTFIAEGGILLGTLVYFILLAYYPLSHLLPLLAVVAVSACTMAIYTSLVETILNKKDIHG